MYSLPNTVFLVFYRISGCLHRYIGLHSLHGASNLIKYFVKLATMSAKNVVTKQKNFFFFFFLFFEKSLKLDKKS